jgi:hypothetical protein
MDFSCSSLIVASRIWRRVASLRGRPTIDLVVDTGLLVDIFKIPYPGAFVSKKQKPRMALVNILISVRSVQYIVCIGKFPLWLYACPKKARDHDFAGFDEKGWGLLIKLSAVL